MRATLWTNEMGYIIVLARVARDLWQHKPSLSSGYTLGLGSLYSHKSLAPCYNYNITAGMHTVYSYRVDVDMVVWRPFT